MAFAFAATISDPGKLVDDSALLQNMNAALAEWSQYLSGAGTLQIQVNVAATTTLGTAQGGSATTVFVGKDGTLNEWLSSATYELLTGTHASGTQFDGIITIDPTFFTKGWTDLTKPLPANSYSIENVLAHELGHIFGISSFRDKATGQLTGNAESVWDSSIRLGAGGTATFVGSHAVATYGAPVPVTTTPLSGGQTSEFYSHIGNNAADHLGTIDLMSGVSSPLGHVQPVSAVDVAIATDLLNPVSSSLNAQVLTQANTAGAILELFQAMTGSTPNLLGFAGAVQTITAIETTAGTSGGASNGWIGFGASLADSRFATAFSANFVGKTDVPFITAVVTDVFGAAPSTVKDATSGKSQVDVLQSELSILRAYYAAVPNSTDPAGTVRAQGAFLADMLHQATDAHSGRYVVAEATFLTHAASHSSDFGSSLFTAFV